MRLRRVGLLPGDPAALAAELRPDMLGLWLPLALADILRAWCDADRVKVLRSWGLNLMADRLDDAGMDSFLDRFKADGETNKT